MQDLTVGLHGPGGCRIEPIVIVGTCSVLRESGSVRHNPRALVHSRSLGLVGQRVVLGADIVPGWYLPPLL